jgi:hypothetical protein
MCWLSAYNALFAGGRAVQLAKFGSFGPAASTAVAAGRLCSARPFRMSDAANRTVRVGTAIGCTRTCAGAPGGT